MKYNPMNEWMNVTKILHLLINLCVKCVFNAQYQCVKCTNYEWTKFAWFSLLSCEMLSLWWHLYKHNMPWDKRLTPNTQPLSR
jgi:hypothetical protein